jgi:hypothetical protein
LQSPFPAPSLEKSRAGGGTAGILYNAFAKNAGRRPRPERPAVS